MVLECRKMYYSEIQSFYTLLFSHGSFAHGMLVQYCAILCNIDNYSIFHASKVKGHGNQQPVVTVTQISKASTFMRSLWLLCSVHAWAEHETLGKYAELRHAKNMPSVSKPFLECLKNCCYKTCWPRNHVETMVTGHLRMRLVCLCLCCFVAMSAAICSTVIAAIW